MAFLGSQIANEVGLRLLLCPLGSNIVIRTACCSVGTVLPVYSTFRAIERKDQIQQQKWLIYWAGWQLVDFLSYSCFLAAVIIGPAFFMFSVIVWIEYFVVLAISYGSFTLVEVFTDKLFSWFPMYYHAKFAFLVWLQLPSVEGAKQIYMSHLRPFLLRHQARIDLLMGFAYGEMVKLASKHQAEIEFARTMFLKIMGSADQTLEDASTQPGEQAAIEGRTITSDAGSDHDD